MVESFSGGFQAVMAAVGLLLRFWVGMPSDLTCDTATEYSISVTKSAGSKLLILESSFIHSFIHSIPFHFISFHFFSFILFYFISFIHSFMHACMHPSIIIH